MGANNGKPEEGQPGVNESRPSSDNQTTEARAENAPENAHSTPSQDVPSNTPPASTAHPNTKSSTPSSLPYKTQFSAATQLILSRINKGSGGAPSSPLSSIHTSQLPSSPTQATYEDVKRRLVDKLNTPMTLPMPSTSPESASPAVPTLSQPPAASSSATAAKRKRLAGDGDARSLTPLSAPKPPIKRKRAKDTGSQPMCVKCRRISSTDDNLIIRCACGEAWHQLCHDPEISGQIARSPTSFKCSDCVKEDADKAKYEHELARYHKAKEAQAGLKKQQSEMVKERERRLANLPEFPKPEIIGFEAGNASSDARREYFSGLKKSDLINLLSFSDRLQPGLLVDVLVSVTKRHPELPLFGSPGWAQPQGVPASPQASSRNNGSSSNHAGPPKSSKQRSKTGGVRKILKTAPAEVNNPAVDEEDDDVLPPSWPKAGAGLYARLPPEKDDPFLFDDNDEEAFSHFMVDQQGRQIMEPVKG